MSRWAWIRFGEKVVFLGIDQLVFVRKETSSGTSNPKLRTIRFIGLPFVFASRLSINRGS